MAKQYDVLFRLLMLGDSGVGKTCMLHRFTENEFDPSHVSTIGKQSTNFEHDVCCYTTQFQHRENTRKKTVNVEAARLC